MHSKRLQLPKYFSCRLDGSKTAYFCILIFLLSGEAYVLRTSHAFLVYNRVAPVNRPDVLLSLCVITLELELPEDNH